MILLIMDDCGRNLYPFELTEIITRKSIPTGVFVWLILDSVSMFESLKSPWCIWT